MWFNTLVDSAGGSILKGPRPCRWARPPRRRRTIIHELATSPAADPALSNSDENAGRLAFESGTAAFELNYPFVYPSIQADKPKLAKEMGYTDYPSVNAGQPAKVTIGGSNLGVSSYSKYPKFDFEAIKCLTNKANQKVDAIKGGLPPTLGLAVQRPGAGQALSVQGADQAAAR